MYNLDKKIKPDEEFIKDISLDWLEHTYNALIGLNNILIFIFNYNFLIIQHKLYLFSIFIFHPIIQY